MSNIHEVDFHTYCETCSISKLWKQMRLVRSKYKDNKEDDVNSPCYERLDEPFNVDSRKPLYYNKAD